MVIDTQNALKLLARRRYCRVTQRVREAVATLATGIWESMRDHDLWDLEVPGYGRLSAGTKWREFGGEIVEEWASLRSCEYDEEHDGWCSGGNLCLTENHAAGCDVDGTKLIPRTDHAAGRDEVLDFALHLDQVLISLRKEIVAREDKASRATVAVGVQDE